jgi:iron complex outermembrane recepter protein
MTSNDILRRAIRLTLANAAAASIALPALASAADEAQTVAQPAAAAEEPNTPALTEVVVTGSRIAQPGLESISPVTTVTQADIAAQGFSSVEDVLNNMPQVMADQGSAVSNGATGTSTVNLRNLGPQRTLVLINGRRLMPGNANDTPINAGPADLNNIPIALVDRVDLLTGGASAVYGADAVAGVVNFVMNDHFQGFRVDVNGGAYDHSQHSSYAHFAPAAGDGSAPSSTIDGGNRDVTFIIGNNFADGKGNATAYLEYRSQAPLLEAARDFSRCTLGGGYAKTACSGSGTSATGEFYSVNGNFFPQSLTASTANGGSLVPFTNADKFNYGALNYYQRPDTRWNAGAFAHYDYSDKGQVYSEFMFMSDRTIAQIAPSGAFIGSGTGVDPTTNQPDGDWTVNCNNPLLSAQELGILCNGSQAGSAQVLFGRRNVEGGDRQDDLAHTSFRLVIGTKGEINNVFSYDVYAQEGTTLLQENYQNDVSKSLLSNALQAVTDPATGQVVCAKNASGANGAPGCVPYNIWGTGAVSPASVAYFTVPGLLEGSTEERVYHADMTADLGQVGVKLPTANEGLFLNYGAEYREEFETLRPDQEYITNDLAGQGNPTLPLNAGFGVKEGFLEGRLPLIQDAPFAKELSVEAGYRYSKYDIGYTTNTYKFGVDYAPTADFRVRAGYNRAVRAPNLTELFAERYVGNDGSTDPCAFTTTYNAVASAAQCARSGMTAAQYTGTAGRLGTPANPAGQYNGQLGGNPNLKPEIADTYTFGLVLTPTAIPNLTATIDYFDIKIKNDITTYGANLIINQCVYNDNPQFCAMVHRDSGTGSLWFSTTGYIDDPLANLGYQWTRGVDFGVRYRQEMGAMGRMDINFTGTYTASFITEPYTGSGAYDCAGYFGATCGNPQPKWRHVIRDTWSTPVKSLDLTVSWRHFGSVKDDATSPAPLLNGVPPNGITRIANYEYFDLTASYMVYPGVTARVGVNNVLDKDPPILPTTGLSSAFFNGNTYPQVYDYLGRYLFLNVTADF